ncbi:MAG: EexN family lipoprotein [Burkholderiaceae bacterium]|nr:EexN family lipoprotein [Burkholderiaceae bacterium]
MQRILMMAACGLALAGCSPPGSVDTAESLTADPQRLKEVMHQCKADRAKLGEATCTAASEAWRRRFMGDGKTKYSPAPVPKLLPTLKD